MVEKLGSTDLAEGHAVCIRLFYSSWVSRPSRPLAFISFVDVQACDAMRCEGRRQRMDGWMDGGFIRFCMLRLGAISQKVRNSKHRIPPIFLPPAYLRPCCLDHTQTLPPLTALHAFFSFFFSALCFDRQPLFFIRRTETPRSFHFHIQRQHTYPITVTISPTVPFPFFLLFPLSPFFLSLSPFPLKPRH